MNTNPTPAIQASISGVHFFIGAGSSHRFSEQEDYDFPLGSTLLEGFKLDVSGADPHQLPSDQKSWAIDNFNMHESIDDFLDAAYCLGHCDLVTLGKKFVDREIIGCEQKVARYFEDRSGLLILPWIDRFLNFIIQDANCYEVAYRRLKWVEDNNNSSYPAVNFATLNYDRLIEVSLKNYFARNYPDAIDQITKDFETLGNLVQHHHGSLGSLQERPFGEAQIDRSPTLRFWFEPSKDSHKWPLMNTMINERHHSAFLGFGFHQCIATRFDFQNKKPKIYITAFDKELESEIDKFLSTHKLDTPTVTNGADCCVKLIQEIINEFSK